MIPFQDIPDNVPIYTIKKYRHALERINENVPLSIVKRRIHTSNMVKLSEYFSKQDNKEINRKCAIIDAMLKTPATKVTIIE
jgi:hypothetical protein